jgi:hypothetical protein
LEHFSLLQLLPKLYFELFKRFRVKSGLIGLSSDRLIATLIANPPELHFEQEVRHGDLQYLYYQQDDMHEQQLTIEEDIILPKVISAKQKPKKA